MIIVLKQWLLRRFANADFVIRQRAWVLLLINTAAILLTLTGVVVGIAGGIINSLVMGVASGILIGATASMIFVYFGKYYIAAYITLLFFFISICALNIGTEVDVSGAQETEYLLILIVLPALLLGIRHTIIYGIVSLVALIYVTVMNAAATHMPVYKEIECTIDVFLAAAFLTCVAAMISWVYETALRRERSLIAEQKEHNLAITEMADSLQRSENQKQQFYRDTIYSVTNGKLCIYDTCDIEPYLNNAELTMEISDPNSLTKARHDVSEFCSSIGLTGTPHELFTIAVGEALTNAIKHAHGGRVFIGRKDDSVWAAVSDNGDGIKSLILPQAILLAGYSTKQSLGIGYTIMLDAADKIILRTSEAGTTVVLIKELNPPTPATPLIHYGSLLDMPE